jgi:Flp pilus assembly secretin CpaC
MSALIRKRKGWLAGARKALPSAAVAIALLAPAPTLAADVITVTLDQAKIISLPDGASTIIIGNPIVADVTMLKRNNQMILTGKGFGETNLIALDQSGAAVGESIVRVVAPKTNLVVQRGLERQSYSCAPRCEPTVQLGDTSSYMTEVGAQITQRNQLSQPAGAPTR